MNSATILATLSCYEEALAASEGAIRLEKPGYAPNHVGKGWLLVKLDRYEEALAAYQEASDLAPGDAGIWRTIGDVLTALERTQEAQKAYEKARQLDSGGEA
jgi:tetratricopeptide (TPR) repeat protein